MITGVSIDMMLANGAPFRATYEARGADGVERIVSATYELARDQGATVVRVATHGRDYA
jgi:hypothetical protein